MFKRKSLKTTALIIFGTFIIGISGGAAQVSAADRNSIDKIVETSDVSLSWDKIVRESHKQHKKKRREEAIREYERKRGESYHDGRYDRYDPSRSPYRPAPPPR